MSKMISTSLEKLVLTIFVFVPLVLTPKLTIDAVNIGKFALFVLGSSFAVIVLFNSEMRVFKDQRVLTLAILFLAGIGLPVLFSGAPFQQQLFGTWGRNIGLLTYIGCFVTLCFGILTSKNRHENAVWLNFLACSLLSISYGLFQAFGYDFVTWRAPEVFGSLGNLNFYSAHIGIISSMLIGKLLGPEVQTKSKYLILALLFPCTFLLIKANSTQGFVLVLVSFLVFVHVLFSRRNEKFRYIVPSVLVLSLLLLFWSILTRGTLANLISDEIYSYKVRSLIWQSAIKMFRDHFLFGVGLDSFRDWYLSSRPLEAYRGGDFNEAADSAHNILLEYASVGGIVLFLFGLVLIIYLFHSIAKLVSKSVFTPKDISSTKMAVVFGALAFVIQGMVSPQQIGILSWGFLLCGLALGYAWDEKSYLTNKPFTKMKFLLMWRESKLSIGIMRIFVIIFAILSVFSSVSPIIKEKNMLSAQKEENLVKYIDAINKFPRSAYYYSNGARIVDSAGFYEESMRLGQRAVEEFPRNYELIETVIKLRMVEKTYKEMLLRQLATLNPPR